MKHKVSIETTLIAFLITAITTIILLISLVASVSELKNVANNIYQLQADQMVCLQDAKTYGGSCQLEYEDEEYYWYLKPEYLQEQL